MLMEALNLNRTFCMFVSFILRRPFAFWWYAIADKYKLESFNESIILIFIPTDDYANSQSQSIIIIIAMQYFRAQQIASWLRKGQENWINQLNSSLGITSTILLYNFHNFWLQPFETHWFQWQGNAFVWKYDSTQFS